MYSIPLDVLVLGRAGLVRSAACQLLAQESVCRLVERGFEEGLQELERRRFDAILVHHEREPGGVELLREVCRLAPEAAVLVLAAHPDRMHGLSAVQNGAHEYLCLSALGPGELYHRLRLAVERRRFETTHELARDQMVQVQKMEALGRVAAGMTHDFRNLVTIILGNCQILRRLLPDEDRLRAPVDEIILAGHKANNVVGHLLQFAREQKRERTELDLNELVREMESLARPLLQQRIRLELSLAEQEVPAVVNRTSLEQILMNLLVNAVDAVHPETGRIWLSVEIVRTPAAYLARGLCLEHPAYALVTVADNGRGLEPGSRPRLFEPFYTTKPRGTGLGLSTAYALARENEGHLGVTSRPNVGTAFQLFLPLAVQLPELPDCPGTFLILDRDDEERVSLRRTLQKLGADVLEARCLEDVPRMMTSSRRPDWILAEAEQAEGSLETLAQYGCSLVLLSGLPASLREPPGGWPVLTRPVSAEKLVQMTRAGASGTGPLIPSPGPSPWVLLPPADRLQESL